MRRQHIRHCIANLKHHYNLTGDDILACYDTAIVGLVDSSNDYRGYDLPYLTVSVSPKTWNSIVETTHESLFVKHPGSGVDCIKLFNVMYLRKETKVADADVQWSPLLSCWTPTKAYLTSNMESVVMAKRSTKKQIEYANSILIKLDEGIYHVHK